MTKSEQTGDELKKIWDLDQDSPPLTIWGIIDCDVPEIVEKALIGNFDSIYQS